MVEVVEKLASCQPHPCHELEDEEVQVGVHEVNTKSVKNAQKLHFVPVGSAQIPERKVFLVSWIPLRSRRVEQSV